VAWRPSTKSELVSRGYSQKLVTKLSTSSGGGGTSPPSIPSSKIVKSEKLKAYDQVQAALRAGTITSTQAMSLRRNIDRGATATATVSSQISAKARHTAELAAKKGVSVRDVRTAYTKGKVYVDESGKTVSANVAVKLLKAGQLYEAPARSAQIVQPRKTPPTRTVSQRLQQGAVYYNPETQQSVHVKYDYNSAELKKRGWVKTSGLGQTYTVTSAPKPKKLSPMEYFEKHHGPKAPVFPLPTKTVLTEKQKLQSAWFARGQPSAVGRITAVKTAVKKEKTAQEFTLGATEKYLSAPSTEMILPASFAYSHPAITAKERKADIKRYFRSLDVYRGYKTVLHPRVDPSVGELSTQMIPTKIRKPSTTARELAAERELRVQEVGGFTPIRIAFSTGLGTITGAAIGARAGPKGALVGAVGGGISGFTGGIVGEGVEDITYISSGNPLLAQVAGIGAGIAAGVGAGRLYYGGIARADMPVSAKVAGTYKIGDLSDDYFTYNVRLGRGGAIFVKTRAGAIKVHPFSKLWKGDIMVRAKPHGVAPLSMQTDILAHRAKQTIGFLPADADDALFQTMDIRSMGQWGDEAFYGYAATKPYAVVQTPEGIHKAGYTYFSTDTQKYLKSMGIPDPIKTRIGGEAYGSFTAHPKDVGMGKMVTTHYYKGYGLIGRETGDDFFAAWGKPVNLPYKTNIGLVYEQQTVPIGAGKTIVGGIPKGTITGTGTVTKAFQTAKLEGAGGLVSKKLVGEAFKQQTVQAHKFITPSLVFKPAAGAAVTGLISKTKIKPLTFSIPKQAQVSKTRTFENIASRQIGVTRTKEDTRLESITITPLKTASIERTKLFGVVTPKTITQPRLKHLEKTYSGAGTIQISLSKNLEAVATGTRISTRTLTQTKTTPITTIGFAPSPPPPPPPKLPVTGFPGLGEILKEKRKRHISPKKTGGKRGKKSRVGIRIKASPLAHFAYGGKTPILTGKQLKKYKTGAMRGAGFFQRLPLPIKNLRGF